MQLVLLVLALIFSSQLIAQEDDDNTIEWMKWDNPPVFINSGNWKGRGFSDIVQSEIEKKLVKLNHKTIQANIQRIILLAQSGFKSCNTSWIDTPEWGKIFYFSKPYVTIRPNGLIIRKSIINKIDATHMNGKLKLAFFVENLKLKGVISRRYGEGIDEYLDSINYEKNNRFIVVSTDIIAKRYLLSGRVDYMIGYPFELTYLDIIKPGTSRDFQYVPLADNKSTVSIVFACVKNEWGKDKIDKINEVLTPEVMSRFQSYFDAWENNHLDELPITNE